MKKESSVLRRSAGTGKAGHVSAVATPLGRVSVHGQGIGDIDTQIGGKNETYMVIKK